MKIKVDKKNKIVDVYVEEDFGCPIPFLISHPITKRRIAHEGVEIPVFLKLIEQTLDEIKQSNKRKLRMRYCPVCRRSLDIMIPLEEERNGIVVKIWDCRCLSCGWKGEMVNLCP